MVDAIILNLTGQYMGLLDREQLTKREYQPVYVQHVLFLEEENF